MSGNDWPQAYNYIVNDGGHAPSLFAKTFAETIPGEVDEQRFLDIGCGSGIIGLYCLIEKIASFVTFNDVLDELLTVAKSNAENKIAQGIIEPSQVAFLKSSFTEIPADIIAQHTLLGFNPPQLPDKYMKAAGLDPVTVSFRSGGSDGLDIAREFFRWYADLPQPKPDAVIELSSFLGWKRITDAIQGFKISWQPIAKTRIPLRKFMRDDADTLSENEAELADRSLKRGEDGEWTKELISILLTQG